MEFPVQLAVGPSCRSRLIGFINFATFITPIGKVACLTLARYSFSKSVWNTNRNYEVPVKCKILKT